MKILYDTSAFVAAVLGSHPAHAEAHRVLDLARSGGERGLVAAHTLAESYAVLSAIPTHPRLRPHQVNQIIRENLDGFRVITLSVRDHRAVLQQMESLELSGGAIYDVLIARAAIKAGADRLVTLNARHFNRLGDDVATIVWVPTTTT